MAVVLTYSTGVPVMKVGRIAGQFAKPRSAAIETVATGSCRRSAATLSTTSLPTEAARTPDPDRLVQAYHQSAATLNLLRAFTKGGFADLSQVHQWNQEFVASSPEGRRYDRVADNIDRALRFMAACGIDTVSQPSLHEVDFFTSHESLILGYEEALTRRDSLTGDWYDCSAHMLWIGERSRQIDGAHVEFLRGVGNPVGCKLGPTASAEDALAAVRGAQPRADPGSPDAHPPDGGRTPSPTGSPPLLAAVRDAGHPVVWACDPDARQHVHLRHRPQDPRLRRRPGRDRRASSPPTGPRAPGPAGCTSS